MKQHFWLARVTVEASSPLHVGSGEGDALRDAMFVRGHGGLPFLPATSLAGVVRSSMVAAGVPEAVVVKLFGTIGKSASEAAASRLVVSDGYVNGASGTPVDLDEQPGADEVLQLCAGGATRDHIALNGAGVAEARRKYDFTAVPRGAQFSFELRIDGEGTTKVSETEISAVVRALADLRMGAKTKSGHGRLVLNPSSWHRTFDLANLRDRDAWKELNRHASALRELPGGAVLQLPKDQGGNANDLMPVLTLPLEAEAYLLIGQGDPLDDVPQHWNVGKNKPRAKLPLTERAITWTEGRGKVGEAQPVLPASGIKGALRHRTLFHLRRLVGRSALPARSAEAETESLFGSVNSHDADDQGCPGVVIIDDVVLDASYLKASGALTHVALDRYTGGPMLGALFGEAPLYKPEFKLRVELADCPADANLRKAFVFALRDLVEGRLAIGTGRNAGHGFLKGKVEPLYKLKSWLRGNP